MKQYHNTFVLTAKADYRRIISASQDKNILVVDFGSEVEDAELLKGLFYQ
jgi:F-box and WD-40 domain protein 1/11